MLKELNCHDSLPVENGLDDRRCYEVKHPKKKSDYVAPGLSFPVTLEKFEFLYSEEADENHVHWQCVCACQRLRPVA